MSDQFTDIVKTLEGPETGGLFVQKRIPCVEVVEVYAAKKIESELEALLVQVDPKFLPGIDEWPQSEGFHVEVRPGAPGEATLVCLELASVRYREVFLALAEDIVRVLSDESDPKKAVRRMLRRLYQWQDFLKRHRPEGLSADAQAGLFGELLILDRYFLPHLDHAFAVKGWRGCKKAHQDFQFPGFALEVKTTRAVSPDRIHISNIQQLDEEGIETMFLTLVSVHPNESSGDALKDLVARIRDILSPGALVLFNEGLLEVGYLDIHDSHYEQPLYQVREILHFMVADEFPRLLRDGMPKGVKDVKYQIGLDACCPFKSGNESVLDAI